MGASDLNLLQGTLDVLILKALAAAPRHGYGVARWIRETTDDTLDIEDGALYTALHRMQKRKWLESEWGVSENNRRAKFYELTRTGRKQLATRSRQWERYSDAVSKVLQSV